MKVLVFNSGSSSIKTELVDTDSEVSEQEPKSAKGVAAVAHRIVHGGPELVKPARIDDALIRKLTALEPLAPLHNAKALDGIKNAQRDFPQLPHFAVFDTAFHHDLPDESKLYAINKAVAERYSIRRYGFHGISYAYVATRKPRGRVIACHLGSGASVCAIKDGKSIATSMGLTPTAGLVMGTRSGDIDPGVLSFLARSGWDAPAIDELLNHDSGLKGLTGHADIRDVHDATALSIFRTRIVEYIGAYVARLEGCDAIVFTGGIGEHDQATRQAVIDKFAWLGAQLDPQQNAAISGSDGVISAASSRIVIEVIVAREALQMARDVALVLGSKA